MNDEVRVESEEVRVSKWNKKKIFIVLGIGAFSILLLYAGFMRAPAGFPIGAVVKIESGLSITAVSELLGEKSLIRSPRLFSWIVRTQSPRAGVLSDVYVFPEKENVFSIAYRLTRGITKVTPVRVTIPEGSSVREIALILKQNLVAFDDVKFIAIARGDEGYLFPDTYFFLPATSPEEVIRTMKDNFAKRTENIRGSPDILIMASLLEKEARQMETRRTIAGILWKRLEIGMPLQVDAVFGYIFNRDTYSPTFEDLTIDSPYNTYKYKGLPPTPINNPGLDAIQAALTPIESPYLYYLTDQEGNIYYARTYEDHLANKAKARN